MYVRIHSHGTNKFEATENCLDVEFFDFR